MYLPLSEGVIKTGELKTHNFDNTRMYIYFNQNFDKYALIQFYAYDTIGYNFAYIASMHLSQKNNQLKWKVVDKRANMSETEAKVMQMNFERMLAYICYIKDNPKIKFAKERNDKKTTRTNTTKLKKSDDNVKYTIQLGEKTIYKTNFKKETMKSFKKRERHVSCWTVMAFERKYKSGKTVMVKSHTRGQGSKIKKDYIVKN